MDQQQQGKAHLTQLVGGNVVGIRAAASLAPDCRLPGLRLQSATGNEPRLLHLASYPPAHCAGRALFPISTRTGLRGFR